PRAPAPPPANGRRHAAPPSRPAFAPRLRAPPSHADGFVVVTPECNRPLPASLRQAVDHAPDAWRAGPVASVSHGHGSRGLYAVEQLRSVFTELHAVSLRHGVGLNLLDDLFEPDRHRSVGPMLDELARRGLALRDVRAARPYIS
ncbi:NADPH-dependent FMN reductase, partial [Streptomyces sp. NPDC059013]|uniref:NADPH-dependent FMN reductase n=2 Tax=unclassified Streptomyces TaxID=2593676 RepID=UPI0036B64062